MLGKCDKNNPFSRRGQSLIETMVAVSFLTVGFLSVFSLLGRSLSTNRSSTENYIATYLASEGIEVARNIIDANGIQKLPWNSGFVNGDYEVQYDSTSFLPNNNNFLRYDPANNLYSYSGSTITPFTRIVRVTTVNSDEIRINSIVSWTGLGSGSFTVNLEDHFMNWRTGNASSSGPAAIGLTGTYTDWYFPDSASGYDNFALDVTVNADPSPQSFFYSTEFWFANGDGSASTTGYFGIQTQGASPGPTGKIAIFSIWDALAAQGPDFAAPFGGEGIGYSVRISYPWIADRTYHMRIGKLSADPDGQWWGAWVKDTVTNIESYIGKIKVPLQSVKLYAIPVSWTEYYGANPSSCDGYNFSEVTFSNVAANDGALATNGHNNHLSSPAKCPGSSFVDTANGVSQLTGK